MICSLDEWWTLLRRIPKSLLCIRRCISFYFCQYVMYLNIASYLYGKHIKLKLGIKLYLHVHVWMIFICVHLILHFLRECRAMILEYIWDCVIQSLNYKSSVQINYACHRWPIDGTMVWGGHSLVLGLQSELLYTKQTLIYFRTLAYYIWRKTILSHRSPMT